jgi:hypothetical protein
VFECGLVFTCRKMLSIFAINYILRPYAEVLAGALRDNNRARVLGATTFGKGLIQTLVRTRKKCSPLDGGRRESLVPPYTQCTGARHSRGPGRMSGASLYTRKRLSRYLPSRSHDMRGTG